MKILNHKELANLNHDDLADYQSKLAQAIKDADKELGSKEKDYENIPANEWDYDHDDLMTKLDERVTETNHHEGDWQENLVKIREFLEKRDLAKEPNPRYSTTGERVIEWCEKGPESRVVEALNEIFDMTFEWCEEDQCYYEDIICL